MVVRESKYNTGIKEQGIRIPPRRPRPRPRKGLQTMIPSSLIPDEGLPVVFPDLPEEDIPVYDPDKKEEPVKNYK